MTTRLRKLISGLSPTETQRYWASVRTHEQTGRLSADQKYYLAECAKLNRDPSVAQLSQLASGPDEAA